MQNTMLGGEALLGFSALRADMLAVPHVCAGVILGRGALERCGLGSNLQEVASCTHLRSLLPSGPEVTGSSKF